MIFELILDFSEDFPHETIMGLFPYYHIYGSTTITAANLYIGSKVLVMNQFDPMTFGELIKKHDVIFFVHLFFIKLN